MKKISFAKQLLSDFGIRLDSPVELKGDNQAALLIAKKGVISRTKHIDLRRFYIKDAIDRNEITLSYVSTQENIADICTKPVKRNVQEHLCSLLFCLWEGITAG